MVNRDVLRSKSRLFLSFLGNTIMLNGSRYIVENGEKNFIFRNKRPCTVGECSLHQAHPDILLRN